MPSLKLTPDWGYLVYLYHPASCARRQLFKFLYEVKPLLRLEARFI